MPRTKYGKKIKRTILVVGEGPTEKAFLNHIKELYFVSRECGVVFKVRDGYGGSPKSVVSRAVRLCSLCSYDECYVLIDDDQTFNPDRKLRNNIGKYKMKIIKAIPCIEGLFLAILKHPGINSPTVRSDWCKNTFEKKYLSKDQKINKTAYNRIFSKRKLEKAKNYIAELEDVLQIFRI